MDIYKQLHVFAESIWFPFLVGSMSAINIFTLVLSAPTALLYVTGVLAKPSRFVLNAFINAIGTMIGVVALVYLIEQSGEGTKYIENQFPSLFESPKWKSVESALESQQQYGLVGVGLVSAMPIILHPIIVFCMLAKIDTMQWMAAMFVGRVLKYTVMGALAISAPAALRFFGVDVKKIMGSDNKSKKSS